MVTELENAMSVRIKGYAEFRMTVPNIVREHVPNPKIWLDTGCGTGGSACTFVNRFPNTQFVLADPSSENIAIAKQTMHGEQRCLYVTNPTDKLNFGDETLDVVTSMFAHHYCRNIEERKTATENCYRMLKRGGIFIVSEHVTHPNNQNEMDSEWKEYMMSSGLSEEEADEMISNRNSVYFPISESAYTDLLKGIGFTEVHVFWSTCSDVGLYAVK